MDQLQKDVEMLKSPGDTAKGKGLDLQKLEFKVEKMEQSIREDFDWVKKIGLPLTMIAFIGLFFSIYKASLGFALENAKKAIDKAYLSDEDLFKREKKILVLTKTDGDTTFLRKFVHDTGFSDVATFPDNNLSELTEKTLADVKGGERFDLILMNNEDEAARFSNDELKLCLSKTPDSTMIFHFGKPNLDLELMANQRVSSAGFKSQIYGNLINALKYQKYLRQPASSQNA